MCDNRIEGFHTMLLSEMVAESKAPHLALLKITSVPQSLLSNSTQLMEGSSLPLQQPQWLPPACF